MNRYSSRTNDLGSDFLTTKLKNAINYDRIAGYFCSSILDIANEAFNEVTDKIRIICSSRISLDDVKIAGLAKIYIKQEWCEFNPEEKCAVVATERLLRLFNLLSSQKMEIKVLPEEIYGLMHGKAGVITYTDGRRTSFIGSNNETLSAYKNNYEMIWEDSNADSVNWVQMEFDYFWNNPYSIPLSDFVISDIERIAKRKIIPISDWREGNSDIESALVEESINRKEYGLWAHQKYFIARAFDEHKQFNGARLLLADMVGLGKTVQLAMSAKLMALYGGKPVLIIVPKNIMRQWQDELMSLLDIPSAIWSGHAWIDETGYEYPAESVNSILKCPRKIGIISQGLITHKSDAAELLKHLKYECIILDEAHRARRKNIGKKNEKAQPNNLLAYMNDISIQTQSLLLSTATPIQIDTIEIFDLINILAIPNERILGDRFSIWKKKPYMGMEYISGEQVIPEEENQMWQIVRNPFPPANEDRLFRTLRSQLDISDTQFVLRQSDYGNLNTPQKNKIKELCRDNKYAENHNPYVRSIVRRTRKFLENTINKETGLPYLKKINVKLLGEKDTEALTLDGYMEQAYNTARDFCRLLSQRVKGAGFMSTLILKRIGSTMLAGENSAKKILAWVNQDGMHSNNYESFDEYDIDDFNDDYPNSEIKNLTSDELSCLNHLISILNANRATDPKYIRIYEILNKGTDNGEPWKDKGCILFSQYYDSAKYVAELLSKDLTNTYIGLYAGGEKSGLYINGNYHKKSKDELKNMVKSHQIKVLVGTDAASEGLNLQTLSTLINIDLPWNPTRLEQRKGRIQRIGQMADNILIYNLRYKDSVEDIVHKKLSDRLQSIYEIFGQIPEVLEDVWVAMALNDERKAREAINKIPQKNPFINKYETNVPEFKDWEKCSVVLDQQEKQKELIKGW